MQYMGLQNIYIVLAILTFAVAVAAGLLVRNHPSEMQLPSIESIVAEETNKPEFPGRFSYHTSCPLKVSNAGVFLCGVNLQEFVDVVLNLGRLRGDNYPLEDFCMLIRHVGEHCVNRVLAGANLQL